MFLIIMSYKICYFIKNNKMKNDLERILKIIIIINFVGFSLKSSYDAIESLYKYGSVRSNHLETGTLISKSNDEVKIKHGHQTELYLNMMFDKSGFQSMHVNETTYFKFQKGDRVSFYLDNEESGLFIMEKTYGIAFTVIAGLILFSVGCMWLLGIKIDK